MYAVLLVRLRVSIWLSRMRNTPSLAAFNNNKEETNLFDLCVYVCVITAVGEMEADGVESVSG